METRQPTGKPAWPIILLAGAEKSGKTYAAAAASATNLIDRTLWITCGEDDPDEYAPLGRFEIVVQDGTYHGVLNAIRDAAALPTPNGKPHLIVVDSMSMLWAILTDEAQQTANRRKKRDEATISMDLWNRSAKRWRSIMDALRAHSGPVLLTARLSEVAVLGNNGEPTGERRWKVDGHKTLPYDVTAIVQLRSRSEVVLTGVRSMRWAPGPEAEVPVDDFTVADLWQKLGIGQAEDRTHRSADGEASLAAEQSARDDLLARLAAVTADMHRMDVWWQGNHGEPLAEASDLAALLAIVEAGEAKAEAAKAKGADDAAA